MVDANFQGSKDDGAGGVACRRKGGRRATAKNCVSEGCGPELSGDSAGDGPESGHLHHRQSLLRDDCADARHVVQPTAGCSLDHPMFESMLR